VATPRIVRSIVLDATALTEAAQEASQLRIQIRRAVARGAQTYTTAATLTEVLRGHPRDAAIHRLLASLNVRVIDAPLGQAAGERIGRTQSRGNVTLDALVAEVASSLPRPVALLTSDVDDLQGLVDPHVMVLDIAA
jgi:hypothetical protein